MNMNIGNTYNSKIFDQLNNNGIANSKNSDTSKVKHEDDLAAKWIKEIKGSKEKMAKTSDISKNNEANLSEKAQKFLADIREKYGDYDIFVGKNDAEFDALSGSGSKEFSVIISMDEIEKMANDDQYASEKLQMVEGAIDMAKKITEESGYKLAGEEGDGSEKGTINKISITIGDGGEMKIFAELEKTTQLQSDRIAKQRAEHDKASKKNPYEKEEKETVKRTTVEAKNLEELMKKIEEINWEKIQGSKSGDKFNFSV